MISSTSAFSQVAGESQEIPKILMSVNEIRDFPMQGLRNFIITTPGVVDVQRIPTNILRVKVVGAGATLIYIWDSQGRKAIQIEVTGLSSNQIITFRPGYDPGGNEFIYHMTMNNQFANAEVISPFWNHEFSSSVPFNRTNEWRTLLRASTIDPGSATLSDYAPFSNSTILDQFLSYYQTPTYTAAVGDINYNAGELSVTGFPLRGASFQLYSEDRRDQVQVFGGAARPRTRTVELWNSPAENLYGAAVTKEVFPNVSLRSSFVYLDQSKSTSLFTSVPYKNDFVADVGFQARPFTDKLNFEGEYARSKNDDSTRVLGEYTPFWGRVMLSHKRVNSDFINPASFFMQRNYAETNFVTDVKPMRRLGVTLNYQLTELKGDPVLSVEKTNVHRLDVNGLFQATEEKSYLTGLSVSRSDSISAPQSGQRLEFTYQRFYAKTRDQFYGQIYGQHIKNEFLTEFTEKYGGGTDVRYTNNYSRTLQVYLQNTLQLNHVNNTFSNFGSSPKYVETVASLGPAVNYVNAKQTVSGGFYETFTFQNSFNQFSHLLQPFVTAYYSLSQALSFGSRLNLNLDLSNSNTYLSAVAELVYRFGSRVPDTLFSSFIASAQITGIVFVDANHDGQYQPDEKLIQGYTVQINDLPSVANATDRFVVKTDSGPNKITIELPKEYQGYQFGTSNPALADLFARETRVMNFPISQRIPLHGSVSVKDVEVSPLAKDRGLEGVKIEITGENFNEIVETSAAGNFNSFVTQPGKYIAKLRTIDLPRGYKYSGPSKVEFVVEEGAVATVPTFVVQARRFVIGRAFVDKNNNNIFDDGDAPARFVKIKIGTVTTHSEEDGSFSTSAVQPGTYQILVDPSVYQGARLTLLSDRVTIPDAGTIELIIPYQK